MIVTRDTHLRFRPSNGKEKMIISNIIEEHCTRDNPKYIKQKNAGRFTKGMAKIIKTFKVENEEWVVHKANIDVFDAILSAGVTLEKTIDNRINHNKIQCNLRFPPRDEQQKQAISDLLLNFASWGYGCLDAAPSAGKSYILANLITTLKCKTLIVVDMNLLVEQLLETIVEFTDIAAEDIGIIRGNETNWEGKKVVIATSQTLIKREDLCREMYNHFDFVAVDEVHVASCETFQEILPRFAPRYQLGLSGSHLRDDGMDFIVKEMIGHIACSLSREEMVKAGSMISPTLRPLFLRDDEKFELYNNDSADFRKVVEEYYLDDKAIARICKLVKQHYDMGDSQLLICKEKSMVEKYFECCVETILCKNDANIISKYKQLKYEREYVLFQQIEEEKVRTINDFISERSAQMMQKGTKTKEETYSAAEKKRKESIRKLNIAYLKFKDKKWYELEEAVVELGTGSIVTITGDMVKEERNRIIAGANDGSIKVIITTSLFDKAISVSRLSILYLLFSTRERANTMQRNGRISRTMKGKTKAIIYDIIYDHFYSSYQFNNGKGDCRMTAHRQVAQIHPSTEKFLWWMNCRFKETPMPPHVEKEFMANWYKKFVIEL
jgi:superfamily II DNA or RNA helicase